MQTHARVVIIGGGFGGLVTAIALSRMGIDAEVHERSLALREVGAGISLFANDNGRRHRLAKDNIRK